VSAAAITRAVRQAGLEDLSENSLEKFEAYLELLFKWNSKLNLTAIRDPETIIRRHLVESIQCAQVLPRLAEGATLLDFGSGAGLPGIPIAIFRPDIFVTLAESQKKKAAFLREAVRFLQLKADVFDGRVEDMPEGTRFSIITLRAVDKMADACRASLNRIAPGGWVVVFATDTTESALKNSLPEISWCQETRLFGLDRALLLVGQRGQ
jgi:16S rRNA (guanine527-N7)-methyltransferase